MIWLGFRVGRVQTLGWMLFCSSFDVCTLGSRWSLLGCRAGQSCGREQVVLGLLEGSKAKNSSHRERKDIVTQALYPKTQISASWKSFRPISAPLNPQHPTARYGGSWTRSLDGFSKPQGEHHQLEQALCLFVCT